ncbi:MAG: hypothetical protein JSW40_01645, partial [Candidatus Omnitrophota bacterium]
DTILEFDFRSANQGEVHAIGFDQDVNLSSGSAFKVYGTQGWGITDYADYSSTAPNTKHYTIPVGQHFTGAFNYLIFGNDHDVSSPTAESYFSNVRIYEDVPITTPGDVDGDGKVDITDLVIVAQAFGSQPSDSNWDARADIDGSNFIDISDLVVVAQNFGDGV